jgi:hypothetical protein
VRSLEDPRTKLEILSRLRRVRPESRRQWGRMSPHQMVCHLSDSFEIAMGGKKATPAGTVFHRTIIRWIAFHAPLQWPKNYRTLPEADQEIGGTRPEDFVQDLETLGGLIDRFTAVPRTFVWAPHPIFGPLSDREWMRWGYLHTDHHLRQFDE